MIRSYLGKSFFVGMTAMTLAFASACADDDDDSPAGSGGTNSTGGKGGTGSAGEGGSGNAGSAGEGGSGETSQTILDIATTDPRFSILAEAVTKADLLGALGGDNLTVFAPTNEAFEALFEAIGVEGIDDLSAEQLAPILKYHVLGTKVDAAAAIAVAEDNGRAEALGGKVALSLDGEDLKLDANATVTQADVMAENGIVHVIDAVILPSITDVVVSDDGFASLEAAVTVAELAETLDDDSGTFTLFAPGNDAFTALVGALAADESTGITELGDFSKEQLVPVLLYHVAGSSLMAGDVLADEDGVLETLGGSASLDADAVTIDGGAITTTDILTSNGVIHVIDSVILPSIADIVTTSAAFTQLASLVAAADGADGTTPKVGAALDGAAGNGSWTLFAPTDEAVSNLSITAPTGQDLTNVLLYHAVDAEVSYYAADALALETPTAFDTALSTESITVTGGDSVTIAEGDGGDATVVTVNLFAANGVIHAIDKVLIP